MSDLTNKLVNGEALDSLAKKLNEKIQSDIDEVKESIPEMDLVTTDIIDQAFTDAGL